MSHIYTESATLCLHMFCWEKSSALSLTQNSQRQRHPRTYQNCPCERAMTHTRTHTTHTFVSHTEMVVRTERKGRQARLSSKWSSSPLLLRVSTRSLSTSSIELSVLARHSGAPSQVVVTDEPADRKLNSKNVE